MSPISAAAQDKSSEKVNLPLNFQRGATANVAYSKKRQLNQTSAEEVINATASIKIISTPQNAPLISWTLNSFEVQGGSLDQNDPVIEKILIGLPSEFVADEKGAPIKLHNTKDLIAEINQRVTLPEFAHENYKSFANILNALTVPANEEDTKFLEAMSDFSTEFLNGLFLEIPTLTSLCQGTSLVIGEWDEYQENSEGFGKNIKMNVQYQLGSVDRTNQIAKLYFITTSDKDSQRQKLAEKREKFDLPQLSEKEANDAIIWFEDRAQCSINSETGWVQNMEYGIEYYSRPNLDRKNYKISIDWD